METGSSASLAYLSFYVNYTRELLTAFKLF